MSLGHNKIRRTARFSFVYLAIGALMGCGSGEEKYVRLDKGKGTAQIEGISFEIAQAGRGKASHRNSAKGKQQRHEMTIGEVEIEIARSGDGPWKLKVNETSYGDVNSGDRVAIDSTRGVVVNGKARSPGKT